MLGGKCSEWKIMTDNIISDAFSLLTLNKFTYKAIQDCLYQVWIYAGLTVWYHSDFSKLSYDCSQIVVLDKTITQTTKLIHLYLTAFASDWQYMCFFFFFFSLSSEIFALYKFSKWNNGLWTFISSLDILTTETDLNKVTDSTF